MDDPESPDRIMYMMFNNADYIDAGIIIPSKIDGEEIKSVNIEILEEIDKINKIYISDGIKNVYISNNSPLVIEKLMLPQSVSELSFDYESTTIQNLTMPINANINENSFVGITNITIPINVTSIDDYAFKDCWWITNITIPSSVKSIGTRAFWGCSNLTNIDISSSNTNYSSENGVLFNKDKSEIIYVPMNINSNNYVIPNNVKKIGSYAFCGCTNLKSVTMLNGVKTLGAYTFAGCTNLTNITISNSVETIGDKAFNDCENLTSITIPESVTNIGNYVLGYCKRLKNIEVSANNINYSSEDGVLFNKDKSEIIYVPVNINSNTLKYNIPSSVISIGKFAFSNCNLASVTIPNSVTKIAEEAFSGCNHLTSITIPNGVTTISDYTFDRCSSLTNITIPSSVISIGKFAFSNCNLASVTIPNSVTKIAEGAFSGCKHLKNITIPNGVTSIENYVFDSCSILENIDVSTNNMNYYSDEGVLFNKNKSEIIKVPETKRNNYYIPSSVIKIDDGAFSHCVNLTSITIPNSVKTIGADAFRYCSGLTSITIPNSVAAIGDNAFYYCYKLQKVIVGSDAVKKLMSKCVRTSIIYIDSSIS